MVLIFIISTLYFIRQHYILISWDFISYVLNAKYIFATGSYFEILRPPLSSVFIWIFHLFFGWHLAEYIFIIFVSAVFFYSSYKLARVLGFNPLLFYSLSISYYVLWYGVVNGTELLSIAFLEIGLFYLIKNNSISGLFLAFSALTRYTGLVFFPFLLFLGNIKKIFISLFLFGLAFVPWFVYNYYISGNFFTSIADQYANNILFRNYIQQEVVLEHFFLAFGFLEIFLFVGLILSLYNISKDIKKISFKEILKFTCLRKIDLIMILLFVYTIYSYVNIPIKDQRYLFTIILPVAYFSYIGIEFLFNYLLIFLKKFTAKLQINLFINIFAILFFLLNFATIVSYENEIYKSNIPLDVYQLAIEKMEENEIIDEHIKSNSWIYLNYLEVNSSPSPRKELIEIEVNDGIKIVFFKRVGEPDYANDREFINTLPIVYENEDFIIIGNKSFKSESMVYDISYVESVNNYVENVHNESININSCFIIFHSFELGERLCNFVNFKGFIIDENRALP